MSDSSPKRGRPKRTELLPRTQPEEEPEHVIEMKCWTCTYSFKQTGPHYFPCFCSNCHSPMKRVKK